MNACVYCEQPATYIGSYWDKAAERLRDSATMYCDVHVELAYCARQLNG